MLDYKFIKENLELVKTNIARRNVRADAELVAQLYQQRCALEQQTDELRQERNDNAAAMKEKLEKAERDNLIRCGQKLKEEIAACEEKLKKVIQQLQAEARKIPNMTHPDVPEGTEEKENREIKRVGQIPQFDFKPKDHLELGQALGILDFETAQKVVGQKWYYLKNQIRRSQDSIF